MSIPESIVVQIQALAHGGACIGNILEGPAELIGKKAFVRDTVPGEKVQVQIEKNDKAFVTAKLLSVLSGSPQRVTPQCPYVGACGGCDLQHMHVATQREAKRDMVETTILRHSKLKALHGVELCGADLPAFGYRRRIGLHIDEAGQIGFYRRGSGAVVDIKSCALAHPLLNQALEKLRPFTKQISPSVGGVVLELHENEVGLLCKLVDGATPQFLGVDELRSVFPGMKVEELGFVPPEGDALDDDALGHFSQVNEQGNSVLVAEVLKGLGGQRVTELYAGAGNFSFPIAQTGRHVVAVESDPVLVRIGQKYAKQNKLSEQVTFVQDSCERFVRKQKLESTVLLDPPRSGARGILSAFSPEVVQKIIYVSCSVPTLSRDLKQLAEMGYELESVRVVDMFSQTHHVETVSILRAK